MTDSIHAFAAHVAGTGFQRFDARTIASAKTFILDTLGVGLGGSSGPLASDLPRTMALGGHGNDARVWATGQRLPAQAAALCNTYQTHNSEFDCLHEAAVAHVMTVVLPVAMAGAERSGAVSGKALIEAVVLGVDVAACIGAGATSGLRFFRPATVGAFGGVAALGKLMGLPPRTLVHAFSLAYGQMGGTMQAHTEGSLMLAMQMGFNARNAVVACDLAANGFTGPENILEGPFGYYRLIEESGNAAPFVDSLGSVWRINELAHKPFPSGRATHGIVDACMSLQRQHAIAPAAIAEITARVPPLVHHLVGRPVQPRMDINYARLCAAYVAACALLNGAITMQDFTAEAYRDETRQGLARRIAVEISPGEPNALTPIELDIRMMDGTVHSISLDHVHGAPENPMSREAQLDKFALNCGRASPSPTKAQSSALINAIDTLETLPDVTILVDQMVPEAQ